MSRRVSPRQAEAIRHAATNPPRDEKDRTIQELRDQLAARDDFIARASHELRNPMGAVVVGVTNMMYLARSRPGEVPPWLMSRLEGLERQARNFVRRATTLLDATRIASGRAAIEPQTLDMGEVVQSIVHELTPEAERAGTRLDVQLEPGVHGQWDRGALESIASNLLSNAIKYGAGKPVQIVVIASPKLARLVVSDQGIGIPLEQQQLLFERFERLGAARRETPGFGVGLWIARELARAHGGDITVESTPGHGSIFTASLPRAIHGPQI